MNSTLARSTYYKNPVGSFLLLPSFAFYSSLAGIFWTLGTGGTLVLPPDESRCDLTELVDLMVRHGVSHMLCVPTLYRQLLEEASLDRVSSLRVAIVAGEECPKELVENHYRSNPQAALFNEYGPTEGTVWSSVYRCEPDSRSTRVPIGRPIANAQLYILDSRFQPVPVGVRGELHIAGAGITRGYLNQVELTRQKFVSNPFSDQPGSLYKTGHLAATCRTAILSISAGSTSKLKSADSGSNWVRSRLRWVFAQASARRWFPSSTTRAATNAWSLMWYRKIDKM